MRPRSTFRIGALAPLRRLAWRLGRRIYCHARGDIANDMANNGEAYVQAAVLKGTGCLGGPLIVLDIGANAGDWTQLFLSQLPQRRVSTTRVLLFEPVPATYQRLRENLADMSRSEVALAFPLGMSDQVG